MDRGVPPAVKIGLPAVVKGMCQASLKSLEMWEIVEAFRPLEKHSVSTGLRLSEAARCKVQD